MPCADRAEPELQELPPPRSTPDTKLTAESEHDRTPSPASTLYY